MSKLVFPFLLKRNVVSRHNIKHILPCLSQGRFYTGAKTGEIIVWQQKEEDYIPRLLLVPCLNQTVGPVTAMTLLRMPEPELMVYSEFCLVTAHTDNRIRVWDTNDGRCISISPHDIFVNEQEIKDLRPLFDNQRRFVACIGFSQKVYIVDIWKMRCCRLVMASENEKIVNFYVLRNKEILYITDHLVYYSTDIAELYNPDVFEYGNYILNIQAVNASLKETASSPRVKKQIPQELSLDHDRITQMQLLDFIFVPETQLFMLIYPTKICFFDKDSISKPNEIGMKHMNIFLNDVKNLTKVTYAKHENTSFLLISTKRGDLIYLNLEEAMQLWQLHTSSADQDKTQSNNNYRYMKVRDSHYSNVFLNPCYIINQKYEQIMVSNERDKDLIAMGRNILAVDSTTFKLISFEIIEQTFNFYNLAEDLLAHKEKYSFLQDKEYAATEQEIMGKISRDDDTVLKLTEEHQKYFLKPYFTFALSRDSSSNSNFSNIFHPFFMSHFKTDPSLVLKPDERITVTTMAYHRRVEPQYIFGTNQGRVLIFQLFYSTHEQAFTYFSMKVDAGHEINILYVRKSLLFCSSDKGKLAVYSIAIPDINRAVIQNHRDDSCPNLVEIDVSSLKQYESILVSPLKRVLRVKLLNPSDEETKKDSNYQESVKRYKDQIALILKNNSLVTFSCQTVKIEFECKSNEISVQGVFIEPMLDYLLILNANGSVNLYSTNTGRFERTVVLKDYRYFMDLPELVADYAKHYQEHHRYSATNESINRFGSRIHGVLEYNSRYLKNFLFKMEKEKEKNVEGKYQILSERLGDIEELNLNKMNDSQLVWLLHYSSDFIYASKYKRSGVAFLNLYLDNPVASDDKLASMAHILVIDAKTCFQQKSGDNKKMEESKVSGEFKFSRRKSRTYTLDLANSRVTIIPFIFPWGIDFAMDEEIIQTCSYKIPVFDFYHGIQGIGETFSFLLTDEQPIEKMEVLSNPRGLSPLKSKKDRDGEKGISLRFDNWQTSNYFTTMQALGFMLYFILTSHNEEEKILTTAILRTVEFLNSKSVKLIPNFKPISVNLLTHLCPVDDADLIASSCNLIVSAILHLEKPINSELIIRFYQYIKTSIAQAEKNSQILYPVENFETVLLANLSYWVCFYDSKDDKIYTSLHGEIAEFCFQTIMKIIEISYCLHNPYAVSAGLKLLVDGIAVYKNYIKKLEDLFFNVIMINFHYTASLDENIKGSRDLTNITNPIASKFKNILEEINKQTTDIRSLIKKVSLKALLSLGDAYQKEFVFFVIKEAKNIALNVHYPSVVIEIIRSYIKKYKNKVLPELPRLVEGILYCLDPNNPVLRKSSHKSASHALQTIFRLYENVSFHQQSQRFALAALNTHIIIYDLRTAVKLKTLEGHSAPASCLAFSNSGRFLASFSYQEGSLRIWKVGGASGFLTSVFGVSGKHIKMYDIPRQSYQRLDANPEHTYILEFSEDEKNVKLAIDDTSDFAFDIQ